MGSSRRRLLFAIILALFSTFSINVHSNWNDYFLKKSFELYNKLEAFSLSSAQYQESILKFLQIEMALEADEELKQSLQEFSFERKQIFFRDNHLIKMRPYNNVDEVFVWELSILLSLNQLVTPSFAYEIENHKVIIQPREELICGELLTNPPESLTDLVLLEDYIQAHLLAFILCFDDLSGSNIGISTQYSIRFFDNEDSFKTNFFPHVNECSFFLPFISLAFDWTQYKKQINKSLAKRLNLLISQICDKKDEIIIYAFIRNIPDYYVLNIFERIDLLSKFHFAEGMSFENFIMYLYPTLSEGFEQLSRLVTKVLEKNVGEGTALFFIVHCLKFYEIRIDYRQILDDWIVLYFK